MRYLIIVVALLLLQSCSQGQEIVITKEYIKNGYWSEFNNAIHLEKMKVRKDSLLDIFSPSFKNNVPNHWNITDKLEIDSTFYFGYSGLDTDAGKTKLQGKIYFNKNNNFKWYSNNGKTDTIGELEKKTWYKFSKLKTTPYYVYVYVDSIGKVHRFNIDMSNY